MENDTDEYFPDQSENGETIGCNTELGDCPDVSLAKKKRRVYDAARATF